LADRIDRWQTQSRSMAAGVMTLVFFTLIRVEAFATLTPSRWLVVLVAMAMVGRWCAVFLQALGDPILDDDAPRSLVANPAPVWQIVAISVVVLTVCVLAIGKGAIAAMAIAAAVTFVLGLDAQRRDRGLSGPVVATAAAVGEMLVLLVAVAS
ncbi:MAG TPA: adenosylcobinamide-GDP ribazoletransferase, partial [Kofleriaceae bacterium]|nr:adenosylcobinamide-GDP ribazoletransferase [Kofleriaceae bacterium]